jgi:hypothetical protein
VLFICQKNIIIYDSPKPSQAEINDKIDKIKSDNIKQSACSCCTVA